MIECNNLAELEEYPELFMIEDSRKYKLALHLKSIGVEHFKSQKIKDAFQNFSEALKLLVILDGKDERDIPEDLQKDKMELKLILYNNLAGCHVLHKNWEFAIDLCNSALELDPNNLKALYRRGWSRMEIEDYELSREDLQKALEIDRKNQPIQDKLSALSSRIKSLDQKYANAMRKMFS